MFFEATEAITIPINVSQLTKKVNPNLKSSVAIFSFVLEAAIGQPGHLILVVENLFNELKWQPILHRYSRTKKEKSE